MCVVFVFFFFCFFVVVFLLLLLFFFCFVLFCFLLLVFLQYTRLKLRWTATLENVHSDSLIRIFSWCILNSQGWKVITKTYLYNFDPHFYLLKWGLQGYTLFFLFLLKNIDCGYSLEPPRGGSYEYPQSMFWAEIWKISYFLSENFQFLMVKFLLYLNRRVFVMFFLRTMKLLNFVGRRPTSLRVRSRAGTGGGGRWGWYLGGYCGTDVRASILKPTPFIYLALKKQTGPFMYLIVQNVDLFIFYPLMFYTHILLVVRQISQSIHWIPKRTSSLEKSLREKYTHLSGWWKSGAFHIQIKKNRVSHILFVK